MSEFDRRIAEAMASPIVGWDPSPIASRWLAGHPPWDFRALLRGHLDRASTLLDLGTGGGEFLSSLAPLPRRTFATEGYPPNLPVARRRLEPMGVEVVPIGTDNRIPLPDGSVELVVSRHEEFDPREVRRVLSPGGTFLTQQVGVANYGEINARLGLRAAPATNALENAASLTAEVTAAGLRVSDAREARYADSFRDVGALVWYLRFAPWQAPGFSIERFRPVLEALHDEIERIGGFTVTAHRLLLVADRPL